MQNVGIEEMIEKQYQKDNYLVVHHGKDNLMPVANNLCYIYFSSNALYHAQNSEDFQRRVVEDNRYEWQNIRPKRIPACEIFVRDIWLSWYVQGINCEINSYGKLVDFLKEETSGYEVVCVGASSGGFIGSIIAMEIGAKYCISFAGQFSLRNHFDHLQKNQNLREYLKTNGNYWFEYYLRIPQSDTKIIYVYPNGSEQDQIQYELVKDMNNVITIEVSDNNHGVALYPFALPDFLSYDMDELMEISRGGVYSKLQLSVKIAGYFKLLIFAIRKLSKK